MLRLLIFELAFGNFVFSQSEAFICKSKPYAAASAYFTLNMIMTIAHTEHKLPQEAWPA